MSVVHDRRGYAAGCRCEVCRAANRDYTRAYRAKRRGLTVVETDTNLSVSNDTAGEDVFTPGRVEAAVAREISGLSAAVKREGLVESALTLARILDDRRLATTAPSAQRRLSDTLDKLWRLSAPSKGKLASVAALSERGRRGK